MKRLLRSSFAAGVTAMVLATALGLAWRLATGQLTPAEIVEGQFVLTIPGTLFEAGISTFGPWAKRILLGLFIVGQVVLGGGLGRFLGRWSDSTPSTSLAETASLARSAAAVLLVGASFALFLGGPVALGRSAAMLVFTGLLYAAILEALLLEVAGAKPTGPVTGSLQAGGPPVSTLSRRMILVRAAGAAALGVVVAAVGGIDPSALSPAANSTAELDLTPIPEAPTVPLAAPLTDEALVIPPGVTSEVTPNADFYQVSQAILSDPGIDLATWKLPITGLVTRPTAFGLDDLRALPAIERQHTLTCVSNQVGGNLISNAVWQGVRLADLLARVGVKPGVRRVVLHGADFYEDSITLGRALDPDTLLVHAMNGVTLPTEHGFPLRLLVPNIYGMKNVKWLVGIELVGHDFLGTWQRGGWSNPASIKTMSRVDRPLNPIVGQPMVVGGIAFGGERGLGAVELSVDGGLNWLPTQVRYLNRANVWTPWVVSWTPAARGMAKLLVRAVDGRGEPQTRTYAAPFPDGSSGWHGIDVTVS